MKMVFTDYSFPATLQSLLPNGDSWDAEFEEVVDSIFWKRPNEIVSHPVLVSNGFSPEDVYQQSLGTCWFMSVVIALSVQPGLIKNVFKNETLQDGGPYKFQFHQNGLLREISIDDQIPVNVTKTDGVNYNIAFTKSTNEREMWVSLLEKAYAKLHGGYGEIHGGTPMLAFKELANAVIHMHQISPVLPKFHCNATRIHNTLSQGKGFYTVQTITKEKVMPLENGLSSTHAYGVMKSYWIVHPHTQKQVMLLKIKNSYLDDGWKGNFSDDDVIWNDIDELSKAKVGFRKNTADGIFFMQLEDFCGSDEASFAVFAEATLGPDFNSDGIVEDKYVEKSFLVTDKNSATILVTPSSNSEFLVEASRIDLESVVVLSWAKPDDSQNPVKENAVLVGPLRFGAENRTTYRITADWTYGASVDLGANIRIFAEHPFEAALESQTFDTSLCHSALVTVWIACAGTWLLNYI